MLKPRWVAVVWRVRGLAVLAVGPLVLAACASRPSRIPYPTAYAPPLASATAEPKASGAIGGQASGTADTGADAVLCSAASYDVVAPHCAPRPADYWWRSGAGGCGCDPRPCCPSNYPEKSYAIPAAEILGYEFLLNQFDRHVISEEEYGSDLDSIIDNLTGGWEFDKDPFRMNQFMHPYGGGMYYGFARSAGLNFWESFGYAFAGSALWEIAGETTKPSINDQINTSIGGSFLGEALFRSANLILGGSCGRPSTATELLAAVVSPPTGFNRIAYGDRFDAVYPSNDPAVFFTWSVGFRHFADLTNTHVQAALDSDLGVAALSLDYGLPGKPCYSYTRPFDYFHLDATASSNSDGIPETASIRGLLVGRDCGCGPKYSGIWGLYGTYDYFSPQIFKLGSTGLSLGTTGQYLASDRFALQGSILAGVGFTASGTTANERAERSYRYSLNPQALVALRAVYADVAMLDLTANEYYLANSIDSTRSSGAENVVRAQVSLTIRVLGCHAIRLEYLQANRDARFDSILDTPQNVSSLTVSYTHLSDRYFGIVRP